MSSSDAHTRASTSRSWFSLSSPSAVRDLHPSGGAEYAAVARALFGSKHAAEPLQEDSSWTSGSDGASSCSPPSSGPLLPLLTQRERRRRLTRRRGQPWRSKSRTPRFAGLQAWARRRAVVLAVTIAIPVLVVLLATELRSQVTRTRRWAAELAERERMAIPDLQGQLDLGAWREQWADRQEQLDVELRPLIKRPDAAAVDPSDVWPQWWGNSDEVGASPFDHIPEPLASGQSKRRVLFLTSYWDYLERMNTHTFELVDAAMRHPQLIVDVWGPGWVGYDWNVPLSVNIKRRANRIAELESSKSEHVASQNAMKLESVRARAKARSWFARIFGGNADEDEDEADETWTAPPWDTFDDGCNDDVRFDFAWTISDIYKERDMPHVDPLDCGTLLVQQLGDCHEHRCMKEWYPQANNITVSKYAFELHEVFSVDNVKSHYPDFSLGLFGHSPDTANEWDFYPLPWSQKDRRAAVFGYDGEFYPLRTTVTEYLERSLNDPTLPKSPITRHPHPGYEVSGAQEFRDNPLETYETGHESYETHRALREDFASGMRRSEICVFDSSLERKLIRKYAQAFLSGCVVAGDLPTEHEEALASVMIRLEPTWSMERINDEINAYLAQPEKLHQMALDAFAYARTHLSTTSKISGMLRLVDAHRAGFRGYDHAHSFSSRCRTYWSGDYSQRP